MYFRETLFGAQCAERGDDTGEWEHLVSELGLLDEYGTYLPALNNVREFVRDFRADIKLHY